MAGGGRMTRLSEMSESKLDSGKRFAGTRALVTGAGSGIGAAVAGQLVAEGAHVTGVARTYSALGEVARRLGDSFRPIAGDVTDSDDRRRAVEAAGGANGVLDVLVNNAGGIPFRRHER